MEKTRPNEQEQALIKRALACTGSFMMAFKQAVPLGYDMHDPAVHDLRANLIAEEFKELLDAKDRVDQMDAVCDLLYVTGGTVLALGWRYDLFTTHGYSRPISKAIGECVTVLRKNHPCGLLQDRVASAVVTVARAGGTMFGLDKFRAAFEAVHQNNMDKLWTQSEVSNTPHAYEDVRPLSNDDRRYLVMREDGKVIKPPGHKKVDLTLYV